LDLTYTACRWGAQPMGGARRRDGTGRLDRAIHWLRSPCPRRSTHSSSPERAPCSVGNGSRGRGDGSGLRDTNGGRPSPRSTDMRIYIQLRATPVRRHSQPQSALLEGGAGRPGSRPVACDLFCVGRKERPALSSPTAASRLDRPIHRLQAGYRRLDFAVLRLPNQRLDGLSTNQPTHRTTAPRLLSEARCRHRGPHLRGARMGAYCGADVILCLR
jgi:hypothetical protein